MDYQELLKKARDKLPESVFEKERFEISKRLGGQQLDHKLVVKLNSKGEFRLPGSDKIRNVTKVFKYWKGL